MIKEKVTYEDLDGIIVEEEVLFNLTKAELMELQVAYPEGYGAHLQKIVSSGDQQAIWLAFKDLVLKAYGVRSPDGKRLVKSPQAANEFASSEAFAEIIMNIVTDEDRAVAFIAGLLPKDLGNQMTQANAAQVAEAS